MIKNRCNALMIGMLALGGLGTTGVAVANAGPLEDANAAYQQKDYAAAVKIYRVLAEQGDLKLQNRLGSMYSHGLGVAKDDTEAVKWYRLAAEQGSGNAQWNLGLKMEGGNGVAEDQLHAYMWYTLAADQGVAIAGTSRDDLGAKLTPAQIAQAQEMATKCKASNYKVCD